MHHRLIEHIDQDAKIKQVMFKNLYSISDQSIHSRALKCAKCQIVGIFGTPNTKTKLYQIFQISKIMPHCYSTVSNMRWYGQQLQNWIILFYCVFLSPLPQISLFVNSILFLLSLSLSISSLSSPLKKVAQDHSQESCR